MGHIVLIGDSVLDNGPYVRAGQDVTSHLRAMLPEGWGVTLRARDGSTLVDIGLQLTALPDTASHIVFSCGGNDALERLDLLSEPTADLGAALQRLNRIRREFLLAYDKVLRSVVDVGLPVLACTIYDPQFEEPELQQAAEAALCFFNDGITRVAFSLGVTLVDLRCLFSDKGDMANPIEPSGQGGAKIATAINDICVADAALRRLSYVVASDSPEHP